MPVLEFKGKQLIYAHHLSAPMRGDENTACKEKLLTALEKTCNYARAN